MRSFFLRRVLICLFVFFSVNFVVEGSNSENQLLLDINKKKDSNKQNNLIDNLNNNSQKDSNQQSNSTSNSSSNQSGGGFLDILFKGSVIFNILQFIIGRVLDEAVRNETAKLQEEVNEKLLEEMREKYYYGDQYVDPAACMELFSELLETVIGQKEAIKSMKEQFCAQILKSKEFYSDRFNVRRGPGAEIYCFAGKPGLGKSFVANLLAMALCAGQKGKKVFTIDASTLLSFDKKKRNPATLFARVNRFYNEKSVVVNSDIFSYIKGTTRPVIVFNEIDKLLNDPDLKASLFEFIRSVQEEGYIINDVGEKVDCSGLTIFFTSNDPDMISEESLKTRIRIILFKPFSESEYRILIRSYFDKLVASANEMLQKENRNLSFYINEECCREIAKVICEDPVLYSKGFRCIEKDLISKLSAFLFDYLFFPSKKNVAVTGRRTIGYNNKNDEFFLL